MKSLIFFLTLLCFSSIYADKSKTIEKNFIVNPKQKIIVNDLTGAALSVKSWNKNEVYVNLKIKISSSDDDYENEYIKAADLQTEENENSLTLKYKETDQEGGGWSIFGIKFRINYYERREIVGEIYIPEKNSFETDLRYGELNVENLTGAVEVFGKSNKLKVKNCPMLKTIENEYGNSTIENSGGNLHLTSKSSKVNISNFNGNLDVNSDYSDVNANNVSQKLKLSSKSGKHKLSKIMSDLYVNSDYSDLFISDIKGYADITTKSGTVEVNKVEGISVSADYSKIKIFGVNGKSNKDIVINSTSGNLILEEAVGNVIITNPYSDIDLKKINGNIAVSAKSSNINARDIKGNWNSKTEYVSIKIAKIAAKSIKMTNKSNRIDLDLTTIPSIIDINNEYGDVKINMPKGFSGEIDLTAEYGSIKTDLQLKIKKLGSSSHSYGKIGSGSGNILIETKSGDIELKQDENSQTGFDANKTHYLQNNLISYEFTRRSEFNSGNNFTFSTSYQLGKAGEFYGISFSKWIKTWNSEKVIFRGTVSYMIGNYWNENDLRTSFNRIELGIDSRNTMVLGKDFFNIINLSYLLTTSEIKNGSNITHLKENGWMYSVGFGTRWFKPALLTSRYVWGLQRGIRIGIEFDF